MIKQFAPLYAKGSTGKVLVWKIKVEANTDTASIQKSYGEYDGAQTIKWQHGIVGKNKGKANETSAFEQAILEAQSAINRQKDKGYLTLEEVEQIKEQKIKAAAEQAKTSAFSLKPVNKEDNPKLDKLNLLETFIPKDRTDASGFIKPMLAHTYFKSSKKEYTDPDGEVWKDRKYYYLRNPNNPKTPDTIAAKFPCAAQPKYDGVRAFLSLKDGKVTLTSKEGKEYSLPHITDRLESIKKYLFENTLVYDGELYIHNEPLNEIHSAVNKHNLNTPRIEFIAYDLAISDMTFIDRWGLLKLKLERVYSSNLDIPIKASSKVTIVSDERAQAYTDHCIAQGYEGAMFRDPEAMYQFGKRTNDLLKLKRTISKEFKIIDIVPQEKDRFLGLFVCETENGEQFKVTPTFDKMKKVELLHNKDKFIGKDLTCVFFNYYPSGKPQHVMQTIVRNYE